MRRVALFGGTFDPIHWGHSSMARRAREQCELHEVVFLPCRQSPHKKEAPVASGEDRLAMIELATLETRWATVSRWELDREGPSHSWKTAEHWRRDVLREEDELFWIMGMDQWVACARWARVDYLAALVRFIVFSRRGHAGEEGRLMSRAVFFGGEMEISGTKLRARCAAGAPILADVGPEVAAYVKENGLYGCA